MGLNVVGRIIRVASGGGAMKTNMSLKYSGEAVDAGEMDTYAVAANIIAFSDFIKIAAEIRYGNDVTIKSSVAGYGKGSFVTEMVIDFGGVITTLLSTASPSDIVSLVKDSMSLFRHLEGRPPKTVINKTGCVDVENNAGVINQYSIEAVNLVSNERAGSAIETFIKDGLGNSGIASVSVATDHDGAAETVLHVERDERRSFSKIQFSPDDLEPQDVIGHITIHSPVFDKQSKRWKFLYGGAVVQVDISDSDIADMVMRRGKIVIGDSFKVKMEVIERKTASGYKNYYKVIDVLGFVEGGEQQMLL